MTDLDQLDNPVWSSLHAGHRSMALLNGNAARYPRDISPLAALAEPTAQAFADLRELVETGETVGLVSPVLAEPPAGWEVKRARFIDQMVCSRVLVEADLPLIDLGEVDVPEMVALAAATEPGPFVAGTHRMGRFRGIKSPEGSLMAMAGERMHLRGLTEISAVCTWPQYRGQGLAKALVVAGANRIIAEGDIPFLHVKGENAARQLYEKIGFRTRRQVYFTVMTALPA